MADCRLKTQREAGHTRDEPNDIQCKGHEAGVQYQADDPEHFFPV